MRGVFDAVWRAGVFSDEVLEDFGVGVGLVV